MKRIVVKTLLVLAALGVMAFLFLRSVQGTRAEPYTIAAAHLEGWTLAVEMGSAPTSVLIGLRPPRELAAGLFRQLFTRHAESMNGPSVPVVPLLLRDEFDRSFAGRMSPAQLHDLARQTGLDAAPPVARCMAYRRDSAPGVTKQLYFVVFDAAAFTRFREQAAAAAIENSGFDPLAVSPVLLVAASDANFNQWLPLRAAEGDCIAPISVESRGQS